MTEKEQQEIIEEKIRIIEEKIRLRREIICLKRALQKIIDTAPACFNTEECPLKDGDGFDNHCNDCTCAYLIAYRAINGTEVCNE